jgi:hypothetical protein
MLSFLSFFCHVSKKYKKKFGPYEIAALPLSPKDGHHVLYPVYSRYLKELSKNSTIREKT